MITCQYCQSFKEVPKSLRHMTGDSPKQKVSHRYCRNVSNEVTRTVKACTHFSPTSCIWCTKWDEWIHIIVCINRHKTRKFGCVTCKQFIHEVADVARGKDLYDHFGLKRKNHKPLNGKVDKPLLRRRKLA